MKDARQILIDYHFGRVGGWDIVSWAADLDERLVSDKEAHQKLLCLSYELAEGHNESVKALLQRLIAEDDDPPFAEHLIMDCVSRLEKSELSSMKFVDEFLEVFYEKIDDCPVQCSGWIYRFFNENNGFGFLELQEQSERELLGYIQVLREEED